MSLKSKRTKAKLTQSQLAVMSSVPVRTIRAYEQKTRNINEASYRTLKSLAMALKCEVPDLMD